MEEFLKRLERIEEKLDLLILALAADDEETTFDLSGDPLPPDRDPNQEL